MALTQGMREQIAKDAGVKDPFAKGDKAAAKIIATMAELGLTGGVIGAGGKFVYKGIKGARAMAEARKAIAAAKKAQQAKKTKPIPKLDSKKVEAAKKTKPKPETGRTTVMPKKGRSVTTTTRTTPKTTTQPKKPMKRVQGTDKPSAKKAVKSPPKASPKAPANKGLTKRGPTKFEKGAAGVVGLAVLERATRKKDEAKASTPKTKEGGPGRPFAKSKPTAKYQPANAGKRTGPQYQPANAGKKKQKRTGTSPDKAKDTAELKRTNISASKNTGFGPKGNIFPSSDADRKRLMALYGGTGSRAAAAAARGTQGNLKRGKK